VDGMPKADVGEILKLPVIRPEIELRLEQARRTVSELAAARGDAVSILDRALSGLVSGLGELGAVAEQALSLTRELSRRVSRGKTYASLLSRLDGLDRRILELSSRNIAGFLMQGLIHKIMGNESKKSDEKQIVSVSEEMYRGIAESARFHCTILSRAKYGLGEKK